MELPGIHLLQAAVMLAEVRNYSRAASRLGVQQPTLTKRIVELEHILGFQLFHRTTQFVEPTEACRQFVEEAKQSIFHAERSLSVARSTEKGARAVLHIGKTQHTDPYLISMLMSVELPLYPNLEVCQSSMSASELERELLLGKLDLAIATGEFPNAKLTQLELLRSPFYVGMSEQSLLARHKILTMDLLCDTAWALFDRHLHPDLYDKVFALADAMKTKPRSVHHVANAEEAAQELYAGVAEVAVLSRADAWRVARSGLTMRPLKEPGFELSTKLIAKASNNSRLVSEFVRALKGKLEAPRKAQLNLPLSRT